VGFSTTFGYNASESKLEETCAQVTTPHTIDFKETGWTEVAW